MLARVLNKTLWLRRRSSPAITCLGAPATGLDATDAGRAGDGWGLPGEVGAFDDVTPSVCSFTVPHPRIQDRLPLTPLPGPTHPIAACPSRPPQLPWPGA